MYHFIYIQVIELTSCNCRHCTDACTCLEYGFACTDACRCKNCDNIKTEEAENEIEDIYPYESDSENDEQKELVSAIDSLFIFSSFVLIFMEICTCIDIMYYQKKLVILS